MLLASQHSCLGTMRSASSTVVKTTYRPATDSTPEMSGISSAGCGMAPLIRATYRAKTTSQTWARKASVHKKSTLSCHTKQGVEDYYRNLHARHQHKLEKHQLLFIACRPHRRQPSRLGGCAVRSPLKEQVKVMTLTKAQFSLGRKCHRVSPDLTVTRS